MAKTANNPIAHEFPLMVAALNRRTDRKRLRPGELSDVTGVDGRYIGSLRKFPGMDLTKDLATANCLGLWYFTMQKGTTAFSLRGWLLFYNDGGTHKLAYHYYDEDTGQATWGSKVLSGITLSATSVISVAGPSRFMYIAIEGQTPQVLYNNAVAGADASASFTQADMGPGPLFDAQGDTGTAAPTFSLEEASGYLSAGTYHIAYRFYDSDRGIYSAISDLLVRTVATDDYKVVILNPYSGDPDGAYDQGYDELHVYRTMTAEVAGSTYQAGLLYRETVYDLDSGADCWPATVEVGIVRDEELFFNDVYDPIQDVSGSPPNSGAIAYLEGVIFMGNDRSAGSAVTQLHWSSLNRENPEVLPATGHHFKWDSSDGQVIRFERAGDMLYAFTENGAYRIVKSGSQLVIGRMHGGRSIVGRFAAASLGRDILTVTPLGVSIFDGMRGTLNTIGSLDQIIFEDWIDDWADLFVVTDSVMGCTYIVNPTEEKAAIVWHVTGAIDLLDDCNWVAGCSGPDPESGGLSRAFFITSGGEVLATDHDRDGSFTMFGLSSSLTLNGTATSGSTTTIIDTAATFHAAMVGAYVYVFDPDNNGSWEKRAITAVDVGNDTLTVGVAFSSAVAAADRYAVSPVPFRTRIWEVPTAGSPPQFGRRVSHSMGILSAGHVGVSSNDNAVWRMSLCRNFEDTPPDANCRVVDMDENPSDQWVHVNRDGFAMEPWVEQISSGTDFRLISVGVRGTIEMSSKME